MGWNTSRVRLPSAGVGRRDVYNLCGYAHANHRHLSELPMLDDWTPLL